MTLTRNASSQFDWFHFSPYIQMNVWYAFLRQTSIISTFIFAFSFAVAQPDPNVLSPRTVAAGETHVGFIDDTGTLYTWGGDNADGQLGRVPLSSAVPGDVDLPFAAEALAMNDNYTLVIAGGNLFSFGDNANSVLGRGENAVSPDSPGLISIPRDPEGARPTFRHISAGDDHALAIDSKGYMYLWGNNERRQLGADADRIDSNIELRSFPRVLDANDENGNRLFWATAVAGNGYTIAITADNPDTPTFNEGGQLFGWGNNALLMLGPWNLDDEGFDQSVSVLIDEPINLDADNELENQWRALARSNLTVVALYGNGEADPISGVPGYDLFSWGDPEVSNGLGVLGQRVKSTGSILKFRLNTPDRFEGGAASGWSFIGPGPSHVLAIDSQGVLWGWGANFKGQLNLTPLDPDIVEEPVRLEPEAAPSTRDDWSQVVGGFNFTAAVSSTNEIFVVGDNEQGQFGNGLFVEQEVPNLTGDENQPGLESIDYSATSVISPIRLKIDPLGYGPDPRSLTLEVAQVVVVDENERGFAADFRVELLFSESGVFDENLPVLAERIISADDVSTNAFTVLFDDPSVNFPTFPEAFSLTPGEYEIFANVVAISASNPSGGVDLVPENNFINISSEFSRFDLVPFDITIDREQPLAEGDTINVSYRLRNIGLSPFDENFDAIVYLSQDGDIATATEIGRTENISLANALTGEGQPGDESDLLGPIPATLFAGIFPSGDYQLQVEIRPSRPEFEDSADNNIATKTVQVSGPDLAIESVDFSLAEKTIDGLPAYAANSAIEAQVGIINDGITPFDESLRIRFFYSEDETLSDDDLELVDGGFVFEPGTVAVNEQVTAPSASTSYSMTLPNEISGPGTIIVTVDFDGKPLLDADPLNNEIVTDIFLSNFDLVPFAVSVLEDEPLEIGSEINVNYKVRNLGINASSGLVNVRLYLSDADGVIDEEDELIGAASSVNLGSLQGEGETGDETAVPFTITGILPVDLVAGEFDLLVEILSESPLREDSTANNVASETVLIAGANPALADLALPVARKTVDGLPAYAANSTIQASATILNDGQSALTEDLRLRFFLSEDAALSEDDVELIEGGVLFDPAGLAGNSQITTPEYSLTLPNTPTGQGTILATVEFDDGSLVDADETNNELAADIFLSNFDLLPFGVTTVEDPPLEVGSEVTINYSIRNTGLVGFSGSFDVRLFLSETDGVVDAQDPIIGTATEVGVSLASFDEAGDETTLSITGSLPTDLVAGDYDFVIEVLPSTPVREDIATNNFAFLTAPVTGANPALESIELILAEKTIDGLPAYASSSTIQASATILNDGLAPLDQELRLRFFYSADDVLSDDDVELIDGGRTFDPGGLVANGRVTTPEYSLPLPNSPIGPGTILATVEFSDASLIDADETNNEFNTDIFLSNFDLVPFGLSVDENEPVAVGSTVTVNFDVRNAGLNSFNGQFDVRLYLSDVDGVIDEEDLVIGTLLDTDLELSKGGGSDDETATPLSISGTLPSEVSSGVYALVIEVLPQTPLREDTSENNNAGVSLALSGADPVLRDVIISSSSLINGLPAVAAGVGSTDSTIEVDVEIRNGGVLPLTDDLRVRFFLSADDAIDDFDRELQSSLNSAPVADGGVVFSSFTIAPEGASTFGPVTLAFPPDIVGEFNIIAAVEFANGAFDATQTDSQKVIPIFVSDLDLQPNALRIPDNPDAILEPFETFDVRFDLRQLGLNTLEEDDLFGYSIFLSKDATLDVEDDPVLLRENDVTLADLGFGALETQGEVVISVPNALQIPGFWEIGGSILIVSVDLDDGLRENTNANNTIGLPLVIQPDVDLSITALSLTSTDLPRREDNLGQYNFAITVRNDARSDFPTPNVSSTAVTVDLFYSTDPILDVSGEDRLIASQQTSIDSLNSGQTTRLDLDLDNVGLPDEISAGLAYLIVQIRLSDEIEQDLSNNLFAREVTIDGFDLVPGAVSISGGEINIITDNNGTEDDVSDDFSVFEIRQGTNYQLQLTVRNEGADAFASDETTGTASGQYVVNVYRSDDELLDEDDLLIRTVERVDALDQLTDPLLAEDTEVINLSEIFFDNESVPGRRFLFVEIAANSTQFENDLTNNIRSIPIDLSGRDAAIDSFSIPDPSEGETATSYGLGIDLPDEFEVTIRNVGLTPIEEGLSVSLYLSQDDQFDEGDDLLDNGALTQIPEPALNGTDTLVYAFEDLAFPVGTVAGEYFLLAVVEIESNVIVENATDNNVFGRLVRLVSPDLSLSLTDDFPNKSEYDVGESVGPFSLDVSNVTIGGVAARDADEETLLFVEIFISDDGVLDSSADPLNSAALSDPANSDFEIREFIGAVDSDDDSIRLENLSFDFPENISGGAYTLFFVVNRENAVAEADLNVDLQQRNNVIARQLRLRSPNDAGPALGNARFGFSDPTNQWTEVAESDTVSGLAWQSPFIENGGESESFYVEFVGPAAYVGSGGDLVDDSTHRITGSRMEASDVLRINSPLRLITNPQSDAGFRDQLTISFFGGKLDTDDDGTFEPSGDDAMDPRSEIEVNLNLGEVARQYLNNGSLTLLDSSDNPAVEVSSTELTYSNVHQIVLSGSTQWIAEMLFEIGPSVATDSDGRFTIEYKFERNTLSPIQGRALLGLFVPSYSQTADSGVVGWQTSDGASLPQSNPVAIDAIEGGQLARAEFGSDDVGTARLSTTIYGPALVSFSVAAVEVLEDPGDSLSSSSLTFQIDGQTPSLPTFGFNSVPKSAVYPVVEASAGDVLAFNEPFGGPLDATTGLPTANTDRLSYFLVPAGRHTLQWVATKVGSGTVGFYLDDFMVMTPPLNAYPDLVVTEVDVEPGTYVLDSTANDALFPIGFKLRNEGADLQSQERFGFTEVTLFLSEDEKVSEDEDHRLGTFAILEDSDNLRFIENQDAIVYSGEIALPLDIPEGQYNLLVVASARPSGVAETDPLVVSGDADALTPRIFEYTLANNVVAEPGFSIVRAPNLELLNLDLGSLDTMAQFPGQQGQLSFTIVNLGLGAVEANETFTVNVSLDNRAQPFGRMLLGSFEVSEFMPPRNANFPNGAPIEVTQFVTIPSLRDLLVNWGFIPPGTPEDDGRVAARRFDLNDDEYFIEVSLDVNNTVAESSETNIFSSDNFPIEALPDTISYVDYIFRQASIFDFSLIEDMIYNPTTSDLDQDGLTAFQEYAFQTPPLEGQNSVQADIGADFSFNLDANRYDTSPQFYLEDLVVPPSTDPDTYFVTSFNFVNAIDVQYQVDSSDGTTDLGGELVWVPLLSLGQNGDLPISNLSGFNGLSSRDFVLSVLGRFSNPLDPNEALNFFLRNLYHAQITIRDIEPITTGSRFLRVNAEPNVDAIPDPPISATWTPVNDGTDLLVAFEVARGEPGEAVLIIRRNTIEDRREILAIIDPVSLDDENLVSFTSTFIDTTGISGISYEYFVVVANALGASELQATLFGTPTVTTFTVPFLQ